MESPDLRKPFLHYENNDFSKNIEELTALIAKEGKQGEKKIFDFSKRSNIPSNFVPYLNEITQSMKWTIAEFKINFSHLSEKIEESKKESGKIDVQIISEHITNIIGCYREFSDIIDEIVDRAEKELLAELN